MIRAFPNSITSRLAVAVVISLFAPAAWADPGGSSTKIDQHVLIRVDSQGVSVDYTLTMNRAGAFQEVLAIDKNRDGVLSRDEQDAYFKEIGQQLRVGLELSINGCEQSLEQVGALQLSMPFTKRLQFRIAEPVPTQTARLEFHNDNYLAIDGDVSISVDVTEPFQVTWNSLDQEMLETAAPPPAVEQRRDAIICCQQGLPGVYRQLDQDDGSKMTLALSRGSATSWIACDRRTTGYWLSTLAVAAWVIVSAAWFAMRGSRTVLSLAIIGLIFLAVVPPWFHAPWHQDAQQSPPISDDDAERIFSSLHRNIYGALKAETEDELYDTLARSVDGELLRETYLKMHRLTLTRDLATGLQVRRIKPLESVIVHPPVDSDNGFCVRHRWRVYGIVSHAGHRHARVNEYQATFLVSKNEDGWRISEVNLHDYFRTAPGFVFAATTGGYPIGGNADPSVESFPACPVPSATTAR